MTNSTTGAVWTWSVGVAALLLLGCDSAPGPMKEQSSADLPGTGPSRPITKEEAAKLNIDLAPAGSVADSSVPPAEGPEQELQDDPGPPFPRDCNAFECLIAEETANVNESDQFEVPLATRLNFFDRVEIVGSGEIWAGVAFTGTNGANGWVGWRAGNDYPLPGYAPFSLIGRRDGRAFFVGGGTSFRYYGRGSGLSFIVNDNTHGNGSGAFQAVVRVYRERSRM